MSLAGLEAILEEVKTGGQKFYEIGKDQSQCRSNVM